MLYAADFDSPQSFDYDVLRQVIVDLKACKAVQVRFISLISRSLVSALGAHILQRQMAL